MSPFFQSQVFFIITSIAVIIVTILVVILLIYLIKIVHKFWRVSREYGDEALEIKHTITRARKKITGIFSKKKSKE